MNYPGHVKKTYKKLTNYANRGMDLENLVNMACEKYIENGTAIIYKKPTPIQIVKYDYQKKRITDAFYKSESTLDYNGVYKGYYIEFDAKHTNAASLPLANIAEHQFLHIKRIIEHKGICFLLIMIKEKCFLLTGQLLLEFIKTENRKSIPYSYIKKKGIELEYSYLKGVDFIKGIEKLIKEDTK